MSVGRQSGYRQAQQEHHTTTCIHCQGRGVNRCPSCQGEGCGLCGNTGLEKCNMCQGRGYQEY